MTKVKPSKGASKEGFRNLKNGSIHKKKQHQKFKNTPTGKVALIDGSQQKANGKLKHQNGNKNQHNSPKHNKKSPKNHNSKGFSQMKVKVEEEQDDDDSSDDDINEGISIKEEVSAPEDEVDDDSSSDEDGAVPDIFGKSLNESTDDDDDEFEADSDEEEEEEEQAENKGVKMFKGLKPKTEPKKESTDDDDSEEDDDEDEDDDSSDEDATPVLGLEHLLGDSIADESDDEDFEGAEESDEDDDDDSDEEVDQSLNTSVATSATDEDDEDDEEESSDDDDEDDDDKSMDLTALLGNSLADDSNDEDFDGSVDDEDDDDDISDDDSDDDTPSPAKKLKVVKSEDADEADDDNENNESFDSTIGKSEDEDKKEKISKEEKQERDKRTIFIGNVPKETELSRIKSEFKKFGPIESIRMRGIIPENPKMSLKVASIKRKFHEKSSTVCVFVTYKNVESVEKALVMNGKKLDGNYLRVDHCNQTRSQDKKRTVFLGNLPFSIEDNEIWETFKDCGRIESVRIIRDRNTGISRGFGFVNFETVDGATLAMDLNGTTIKNRELRVKVNTPDGKKQQRAEKGKKRQLAESAKTGSPKKIKTDDSETAVVAKHNSVNAERRKDKKKQKRSQGEKQRVKSESTSPQGKGAGKFQGQKSDAKKKSKVGKASKKKMQLAAKLLAKPKKPSAN